MTDSIKTFEGQTLDNIKELFLLWAGAYESLPSGHIHIWSWEFFIDPKRGVPACHDGVDCYAFVDGEWQELDAVGLLPGEG